MRRAEVIDSCLLTAGEEGNYRFFINVLNAPLRSWNLLIILSFIRLKTFNFVRMHNLIFNTRMNDAINIISNALNKRCGPFRFNSLDKFDQTLLCSLVSSLRIEDYNIIIASYKNNRQYERLIEVIQHIQKPKEITRFKLQYLEYKINEPVSKLLNYFNDPKSGKIVYARTDLKRRYLALDHKDQIKVVRSFLRSKNKEDREWAARQADKVWHPSFEEPLMGALEICVSESVAKTAIKHLQIERIKKQSELLTHVAKLDMCTRLCREESFDINSYQLNIFEYLIVSAHAGKRSSLKEEEIEKRFFGYLYWFIHYKGVESCTYPRSFATIPLLAKAIESLGVLGMTNILLSLIDLMNHVFSHERYKTPGEQFTDASRWIECAWSMEDKHSFLDNGDLPKDDNTNTEVFWSINPHYQIPPIHRWLPVPCSEYLADFLSHYDSAKHLRSLWVEHWNYISEIRPRIYSILIKSPIHYNKEDSSVNVTIYVKTELQKRWIQERFMEYLKTDFEDSVLGNNISLRLSVMLEDDDLPDWDPEPSNADECPWIEEDNNFRSIESSSFDDTPFT